MNEHDLKEKLERIKLLVMDVDGTLTDSAMYYSAKGEELKRFSTRDGMGITLLHKAGLQSAIVTSEESQVALARAEKLKINHIYLGSRNKLAALKNLTENMSISLENIAYIGDDVNDLHAVSVSGCSACPSDAVDVIKNNVDYICKFPGGNGAVREFIELILLTQNKEITLSNNW